MADELCGAGDAAGAAEAGGALAWTAGAVSLLFIDARASRCLDRCTRRDAPECRMPQECEIAGPAV